MPRRPDWPAGYIQQLQARFSSANAALLFAREQGLGIRRQTFLRAWGETRAAMDKREAVQAVRLDRRPIAQEITQLTTRTARGYLYHAHVLVKSGLTGEILTTPMSARYDRLVNYDRALQDILATLRTAQIEEGSLAGDTVIDAVPMEVRELVPELEEGAF